MRGTSCHKRQNKKHGLVNEETTADRDKFFERTLYSEWISILEKTYYFEANAQTLTHRDLFDKIQLIFVSSLPRGTLGASRKKISQDLLI